MIQQGRMMNPTNEREESLFEAARNLGDTARRRAFLAEACGGDAALRARIEALLNSCERADKFFTGCAPALHAVAEAADSAGAILETGSSRSVHQAEEKPSSRIGPY